MKKLPNVILLLILKIIKYILNPKTFIGLTCDQIFYFMLNYKFDPNHINI